MKYILSIIGVCFMLLGCQRASQKDDSLHRKPGFNYVQQIPDSLRTPVQKRLARRLLELSIEHVEVPHNHLVFTMSKDEFRQTGVPIAYYDLFKESMKAANKYIEEHNIQHVEEMMEELRQKKRRVLKEKYK